MVTYLIELLPMCSHLVSLLLAVIELCRTPMWSDPVLALWMVMVVPVELLFHANCFSVYL